MLLRCSLQAQATMFDLSCRVHIKTSSGKMLINHRVCIICMHVCDRLTDTMPDDQGGMLLHVGIDTLKLRNQS